MTNAKPHNVLLIVDDEDSLVELLRSAFVEAGFSVTHVGSGEEGLAEAMMNHPNAILLDILLRGWTAWKSFQSCAKTHGGKWFR